MRVCLFIRQINPDAPQKQVGCRAEDRPGHHGPDELAEAQVAVCCGVSGEDLLAGDRPAGAAISKEPQGGGHRQKKQQSQREDRVLFPPQDQAADKTAQNGQKYIDEILIAVKQLRQIQCAVGYPEQQRQQEQDAERDLPGRDPAASGQSGPLACG